MKMSRHRAHPHCPIKRHDVKWPCNTPVVSFCGRPSWLRASRSFSACGRYLVWRVKFEPDVEALSRGSESAPNRAPIETSQLNGTTTPFLSQLGQNRPGMSAHLSEGAFVGGFR